MKNCRNMVIKLNCNNDDIMVLGSAFSVIQNPAFSQEISR